MSVWSMAARYLVLRPDSSIATAPVRGVFATAGAVAAIMRSYVCASSSAGASSAVSGSGSSTTDPAR